MTWTSSSSPRWMIATIRRTSRSTGSTQRKFESGSTSPARPGSAPGRRCETISGCGWVSTKTTGVSRPAPARGSRRCIRRSPPSPLERLIAETEAEPAAEEEDGEAVGAPATPEPQTIADVMDRARKRIATLSGVRMEAVKLDCRIET